MKAIAENQIDSIARLAAPHFARIARGSDRPEPYGISCKNGIYKFVWDELEAFKASYFLCFQTGDLTHMKTLETINILNRYDS